MDINFRQPKYIMPLLALPFFCLFFYVYHSSASKDKKTVKHMAGINTSVGDVSPDIKKKNLAGKLDAFRNQYKQADGYTAVNPIPADQSSGASFNNSYSDKQKRMLDSINREMKMKFGNQAGQPAGQRQPAGAYTNALTTTYPRSNQYPGLNQVSTNNPRNVSPQDQALTTALADLARRQKEAQALRQNPAASVKAKDPMEVFKQQMAYMDSIGKTKDPAYKAEKQRQLALEKAKTEQANEKVLEVKKATPLADDFNTVMPETKASFIMAIIDEDVTGYAGTRLRLRLLEDITVGKTVIQKGSYLYALISGFTGQRIALTIKTILYDNKLLPVKLDIYDLDGLPGLYVPGSQFRDLSKDLGTNTIQGVSMDGNAQNGNQLLMGSADKAFKSVSSALASAIRKNKANIKYNSYIYLIDSQAQEKAQ